MAEIVNLRSVKKRLARDVARAAAKENRIRNGRGAAEKANDQRAEQRRVALLDAARRGGSGE